MFQYENKIYCWICFNSLRTDIYIVLSHAIGEGQDVDKNIILPYLLKRVSESTQ